MEAMNDELNEVGLAQEEPGQERLTFPKSERLRHKILVDSLFRDGKSLYEYPLRVQFRALTAQELSDSFRIAVPDKIAPLQVMITVPKKKRHRAVDRVLMRRRIREAYRLHRRELRNAIEANPALRTLSIALIYVSEENTDYSRIAGKLRKIIHNLTSRFSPQP